MCQFTTPRCKFCLILIFLEFLALSAAILFTNPDYEGIQVGVPFTLTWKDANGDVTLGLLYKNTSSSTQQSYIIATNINASQFQWTPPDWTAVVFAQKIEAEDATNLTLTGNFTISKAAKSVSSTSSSPSKVVSQPTSSHSSLSTENAKSLPQASSATKTRIGFGIGIVLVLVMIGVALIFFEHGKRVAAGTQAGDPPKSPFGRAEEGLGVLELADMKSRHNKEIVEDLKEETFVEPSTPFLPKKRPELRIAVELDSVGIKREDNLKTAVIDDGEEKRRKKILSLRSVYELG